MSEKHNMMVTDLEPHPFNRDLFRQEKPSSRFIQSVDEELENPIIINHDGEILDGVRRWKAAKELGWQTIQVDKRDYESSEGEKLAILRHNDDREETYSQKMRVALQYEDLVAPIMEKRIHKSNQVELADLSEDSPQLELAEADGKTTREIVGDRIGWSGSKYYHAKRIWEVAKGEDDVSQEITDLGEELVKSLDKDDESVYGAWKTINERIDEDAVLSDSRISWDSIESANILHELRTVETIYKETEADIDSDKNWTSGFQRLRAAYKDQAGMPIEADQAPIFVYLMESNGLVDLSEDKDSIVGSIDHRRPDADLLEELYCDRGITPLELSIRYGVTEPLVHFWLREDGINMKREDFTQSQLQMIDLN